MHLTTSRFSASPTLVAATLLCLSLVPATASAQPDNFEAAPIEYSKSTPDNAIARLQKRLDSGKASLKYEDHFGYLRSLLETLNVSQKSQTLVFSKTSLQRQRISPDAPRSLYFNDDVYIGMCQGGDVLEISVADPKLGTVFYTLDQLEAARPKFVRQTDNCTLCHASSHTQGVPGHTIRSVFTDRQGLPLLAAGSYRIDQTSPLEKRWGGWYVTGTHGSQRHLGNVVYRGTSDPVPTGEPDEGLNLAQLGDRFDASGFLTPHSDIVALMVLEHQTEAHNLITRANFGTRQALHYEAELNRELKEPADKRWDSTTSRIKSVCEPLVRYLLMVEEAPLTAPLVGTSGFAEEFATLGPRDKQGRSLRELDLKTRMFRYPLSYLIYSESFAALPQEAQNYVFRRLHQVLWEEDGNEAIFKHLSSADREAIREILLATYKGLPANWHDQTPSKQ
ncbi:MAG: hypothetical protein J0M17_14125 [Planctomycetes bacterium]|nr:hypothetical protein [Planctomycetota bacterium]